MPQTIRLGPMGRIDTAIDVEVVVADGVVTDARIMGTMARGIEVILRGRDPLDAVVVAQRICGACPAPHAVASAQALDDIIDAKVPSSARVIRNLILGGAHIASHILSFYVAALQDYIDPAVAIFYQGKDERLTAVARKLKALMDAGDAAPFLPRPPADGLTVRDPAVVAGLLVNYFDALLMSRKAQTMVAILAGRHPHISSVVPGGVTIAVTEEQIVQFNYHLQQIADWVEKVMLPDVESLASGPLKSFASGKAGAGRANFLSFGAFDRNISGDYRDRFLPSGAIIEADPTALEQSTVQEVDPEKITESLTYAGYGDAFDGKNPAQVLTELAPKKANAYTYVKGPRYDNKPMEVGPLARMIIKKDRDFMRLVRRAGASVHSVPSRLLARAYECKLVARKMPDWLDDLMKAIGGGEGICDDKTVPDGGRAVALLDAPRGALGHWISLDDAGLIDIYQVVSPSTWNASPRDRSFQRGPIEEALVNTPVDDITNPLNVMRVIRSYDPCIACAVHVIDCSTTSDLHRVG